MSRSSGSESKPFPPQVLSCKLLVDGYNLMYAIGYAQAADTRPKALESGRNRLIELLAEHLGPAANQTCIDFDAGMSPQKDCRNSIKSGPTTFCFLPTTSAPMSAFRRSYNFTATRNGSFCSRPIIACNAKGSLGVPRFETVRTGSKRWSY
jgi:hypothetical protein